MRKVNDMTSTLLHRRLRQSENQIARLTNVQALVDKFLAWPLPKTVCSDLCVTDKDYGFPRSGTNLLSADEARQMIEYLLAPSKS